MKKFNKKAFEGLLSLFIFLAAMLFISAGTLNYLQAWVFLAVFFFAYAWGPRRVPTSCI